MSYFTRQKKTLLKEKLLKTLQEKGGLGICAPIQPV